MLDVALRPVREDDRALLLEVYASTRTAELALVPWSEAQRRAFVAQQFAAQDHHYRTHYAPDIAFDVVLLDGEPAGRLYVARWPREIRVVDVTLLPAARGRGAGRALLERILAEAAATGRSATVHVEPANPARRLYERLGFAVERDHGIYLLMRAHPARAAPPAAG